MFTFHWDRDKFHRPFKAMDTRPAPFDRQVIETFRDSLSTVTGNGTLTFGHKVSNVTFPVDPGSDALNKTLGDLLRKTGDCGNTAMAVS